MNFHTLYKEKLTTPEKIAELVQSGMYVCTDIALSAPPAILKAINHRAETGGLTGAFMSNSLLMIPLSCYSDPAVADNLRTISFFSGTIASKGVNNGLTDVLPFYYQDGPDIIRNFVQVDILAAVVSPMDKHGYFSFGGTASCLPAFVEKAKMIVLEVNDQMPRVLNAPQIHISQVTALCENNMPLLMLPKSPIDEVSTKIGKLIASEIPDGATIQLGIGAIPDAVGNALKDKKHLGIHTEMFTDSMVELIECGAVDNSRKPLHKGYSITTFAFGSKRIYDYIDDNPTIKLLSADEVNNSAIIAQHPDFMSINSALEVDLWGQVCAESIGTYHVSGTGGQVDFVRGATHSKGGKSFMAFASTAKNGTVSRIKPILTPGAIVTTSKNDIDYVVTEYGIAKLRGSTLSQRAKNLIAIAHPKFREELIYAARKQNIII